MVELLDRCEETVALPWTVVEDARDLVAALLSDVFHGCSLWQVLSNEAISVLIGASFPGVVGSGEVDGYSGETFDVLVAVKLCSIVGRDGLE